MQAGDPLTRSGAGLRRAQSEAAGQDQPRPRSDSKGQGQQRLLQMSSLAATGLAAAGVASRAPHEAHDRHGTCLLSAVIYCSTFCCCNELQCLNHGFRHNLLQNVSTRLCPSQSTSPHLIVQRKLCWVITLPHRARGEKYKEMG